MTAKRMSGRRWQVSTLAGEGHVLLWYRNSQDRKKKKPKVVVDTVSNPGNLAFKDIKTKQASLKSYP